MKEMKEIFNYKNLSKEKKICFWFFIICGIWAIALGIIAKQLITILIGLFSFMFCFDLFIQQSNDIIIKRYEELIDVNLEKIKKEISRIEKQLEEERKEK